MVIYISRIYVKVTVYALAVSSLIMLIISLITPIGSIYHDYDDNYYYTQDIYIYTIPSLVNLFFIGILLAIDIVAIFMLIRNPFNKNIPFIMGYSFLGLTYAITLLPASTLTCYFLPKPGIVALIISFILLIFASGIAIREYKFNKKLKGLYTINRNSIIPSIISIFIYYILLCPCNEEYPGLDCLLGIIYIVLPIIFPSLCCPYAFGGLKKSINLIPSYL